MSLKLKNLIAEIAAEDLQMNNENIVLQALSVSMADRIEALIQLSTHVVECWQPCAGDQLLGVLIGIQNPLVLMAKTIKF